MNWQIDSAHSDITFSVRHMMIAKVRGRFTEFGGTVNFDEETPTNTSVHVEIDAASIDTQEEDRDNHLRSGDFLDVENYPKLIFASKRVEQTGDNTGKLIGDLTIRDVTKEVVLDVEYAGQAKSPWGTHQRRLLWLNRNQSQSVRPDLEPGVGNGRCLGWRQDKD
jgi:polyisoprenoid-binding protein YceI